ncbi:MAG: MATE family efflux transporter [Oscillospiraceae bacterium]|nr:MATE family efflux transporter [Oscillospiraceae bacterium]
MAQTQALQQRKPSGHVKNMTVGNPYKLMISFALPVFLSELFQQLYNTADAFIVGQVLGTESLAAVSSSGPLIFLIVSFFTGTAMGGGVVISRYFGAGDETRVSRSIHTILALGLASGLVITVVGVALTPTLLEWLNTDASVMQEAVDYFRYYFMGGLSLVLYNICRSIMNALGDSRRPLYYLIFSSMLNVTLDLLFLAVFRWGVWAAALATVLSQSASVVLCMAHLLKKGNVFTVQLRKIRFHKEMLRQILRYGMPAGVQNSVIAVANVVVQAQINSFGPFAMAAYGVHAKIEGFAFLPITSFNMASSTFVGQNLGARQYDRAKRGARFCILTAVIIAEVIGVIMYFASPHLIGLFDKTEEVIQYGVTQAQTVTLFYCLLAFSHSVAAVCRGAGKAFVPMFVMLSVWCAVRITYILLVMHFFGEIAFVYWAYPLTWGISSVIYLLYYLFSDWVHGFEKKQKAKTNG